MINSLHESERMKETMGRQIKPQGSVALGRLRILREQYERRADDLQKNEVVLNALQEEIKSGDLESLKSGRAFEGREDLEQRVELLRDSIAEAKANLPLLAQAIHELSIEAVPDLVDEYGTWFKEHNPEAIRLSERVVEEWNRVRDTIRTLLSHRAEHEDKIRELYGELKSFGFKKPERLCPPQTEYPVKRSSLAISLKAALDQSISVPAHHQAAQTAGILTVGRLLTRNGKCEEVGA